MPKAPDPPSATTLFYDKGPLLVRGARPPVGLWDERVQAVLFNFEW